MAAVNFEFPRDVPRPCRPTLGADSFCYEVVIDLGADPHVPVNHTFIQVPAAREYAAWGIIVGAKACILNPEWFAIYVDELRRALCNR